MSTTRETHGRPGRLDQRVALVTGGASGLGLATARRLASEGAGVVITDINADAGRAAASEGGFTFLEQDVTEEAQWPAIVAETEHLRGRLQILVNNAGILGPRTLANPEQTTLADWRRIFAVNVESVLLGCQAAIPALNRAGGGSIINISSVAGLLATPYATAYGASKATVRQLTKSVAQHCAEQKFNIRCNSVHPGNVRTPLWDRGTEEAARLRGISFEDAVAEGEAIVPLGDFTLAEDVAAAVAFLASDDARHITGAKIIVDGGLINCDSYHMSAPAQAAPSPAAPPAATP